MTAPALRLVARTYPVSIASRGDARPTTMLAHWSEEDPAAVWITLEDPWSDIGHVVEWCVGRALLVAAYLPAMRDTWIGSGDVKVRYRGATATINLESPAGSCSVIMRGEVLTDFLTAVAALMPIGCVEESEIYAAQIDRELPTLLGGVA